ncbi:hypothetical protein DVH24_021733 [Malus domestica]|uniref:Uncharacterized protein n=1 Tax=Malus domestica TaxID=3750 RepID=A0A498KPF9_MALDO|nr:hypothetical protein DVH24_014665 [Malus domestica]RXI09969.1 hypothetical protein DVH24_021733 [Malus domestica]
MGISHPYVRHLFLRSVVEFNSTINLFSQTQSLPELQVVPILFRHSLKDSDDEIVRNLDHIFGVEPLKVTSSSTDSGVSLALGVLEGCCLLHPDSAVLGHQHKAIQEQEVSERGGTRPTLSVCGVAAAASISRRVATPPAPKDYRNWADEVPEECAEEETHMLLLIRLKCGEFLLVLIGHVNGRDRPPLATVHEDIRRLLGEKSASLIWAASQFGSTLDPEQRLTALHIQARRVIESFDLY